MKLVTDTNILVRCSRGRSGGLVAALRKAGASLVVTDRNVEELAAVLQSVFGMKEREALAETAQVTRPFEVVDDRDYAHRRAVAASRLRAGGEADWPALAAAIALEAAIWSEDVDFFGVGVPVWSSRNVLQAVA